MFRFNFREKFPIPAKKLLERTMRFDEYSKFAPNVTRVEVLSKETFPDGREKTEARLFVNVAFPAPVRALLKLDDLNWKETYIINWEKLALDFDVESPVFTEYVDSGGNSCVRDCGAGCEMVINGRLNIETPLMKGVPEPVVRAAVGIVEPFIGQLVTINTRKYFKNLREALEKECRAGVKR